MDDIEEIFLNKFRSSFPELEIEILELKETLTRKGEKKLYAEYLGQILIAQITKIQIQKYLSKKISFDEMNSFLKKWTILANEAFMYIDVNQIPEYTHWDISVPYSLIFEYLIKKQPKLLKIVEENLELYPRTVLKRLKKFWRENKLKLPEFY